MSIPRVDKNYTMKELEEVGKEFLAVGLKYWEASHKAGIQGAIVWLTDLDGALVLYTRGEYRQRLLLNVDAIGPTRYFGVTKDSDATP